MAMSALMKAKMGLRSKPKTKALKNVGSNAKSLAKKAKAKSKTSKRK